VAASRVLRVAVFRSGLRRYAPEAEPWRPDWICYYFINDAAPPSFVVDVSPYYRQTRRARLLPESVRAGGSRGRGDAVTHATFRQLIESRDAQFGALAGVAFAEGLVVREPVLRQGLLKDPA